MSIYFTVKKPEGASLDSYKTLVKRDLVNMLYSCEGDSPMTLEGEVSPFIVDYSILNANFLFVSLFGCVKRKYSFMLVCLYYIPSRRLRRLD